MKLLLSILLFSVLYSFSAENPEIDKFKSELSEKNKASKLKLISGLKREESAAQSSGNLGLVLTIRDRIAHLENVSDNPFETSKIDEKSDPVPNSFSEKAYASECASNQKSFQARIIAHIQSLELKQKTATRAGKIDDALTLEGMIADLRSTYIPPPVVEEKKDDDPTGVRVGGATMFDLTEMKIVSSKVGYSELGVNKSPDNVHFPKINGSVPKKYLCGVAPHSIVYKIPTGVLKFEATGQRADDLNGSVRLIVKIDGEKVWESKEMSKMSEFEKVSINVPPGAKTIELIADPMGSIVNDYACWIEPKFWKK